MTLIEDLKFKIENRNAMKLLSWLKYQKLSRDIQTHKETIKVKISCKDCSFKLKDKAVLNDHMTNEHSHIKFRSNKRLKEHKHLSSFEHYVAIEKIINCEYCDFSFSDEAIL